MKNRSIKIDDRSIYDNVEDIHELVKEIKTINPGNYHIRRRGRGPRKIHERYSGEYRSYLPLGKSDYVAVYITNAN